MEGRGLVSGSCLYDACYTPGSEHSSNDEMAMQFRYPFEIMVPWHMEDRAAEAVPCIVLCFGNGQKQGRSSWCTRSFSVMHQPNRKQEHQKLRLDLNY